MIGKYSLLKILHEMSANENEMKAKNLIRTQNHAESRILAEAMLLTSSSFQTSRFLG